MNRTAFTVDDSHFTTMTHQISNNILTVSIAEKGAELQSIVNSNTGLEYMWSGDAAFWGKKSPVLFPIVGGLLNNQYTYEKRVYHLNRHGFAREEVFTVTDKTAGSITFTLVDSEQTRENYPFAFNFSLTYTLTANKINVTYNVKNIDEKQLLFSVGGHPAFKVPVAPGTAFTDYYLHFSSVENAGRYPLDAGGQLETFTTPVLNNTDTMPLTKQLFYKDALVFKHLKSTAISIKSNTTPHGLTVHFEGFPFMGIWNAKDADFVCIEPWCGIADSVDTTGELQEKEGINQLAPGEVFERTWSVEVF